MFTAATLVRAWLTARRGERQRDDVARYELDAKARLVRLGEALRTRRWCLRLDVRTEVVGARRVYVVGS